MSESATTRYMLTTFDNPFDPFTQFDEWFQWDLAAGYNTTQLLARIAIVSPDLSDTDQDQAIQDAIEEIVRENVSGMYKKVLEGSFPNPS
jgi:hypothetical protein